MIGKKLAKGVLLLDGKPVRFVRYQVNDVEKAADQLIDQNVEFSILGENVIEIYEHPLRVPQKINVTLDQDQLDWIKVRGNVNEVVRHLVERAKITEEALEEVATEVKCATVDEMIFELLYGNIVIFRHSFYDREELRKVSSEVRNLSTINRYSNLFNTIADAIENAANR